MTRDRDRDRFLVAVLDPVAESDEELQVPTDGLIVSSPTLPNAFRQLPRPWLSVDAHQAPVVPVPVAKVNAIHGEFGVKQVKPCQMHVHHERFQRPPFACRVVQLDSQESLVL
jgi:hypothetical protein